MSSAMRALSNVDAGVVKAEIEIAATPTRVFHSLTDAIGDRAGTNTR